MENEQDYRTGDHSGYNDAKNIWYPLDIMMLTNIVRHLCSYS